MACHNVGEVSKCGGRVAVCSDMNVNAAAIVGVADRSGFAKDADKLLQGVHVLVAEDGADHLALFAVRSGNADILLEFPLPALAVPSGNGAVAIAVGGVFVSACAEEVGGKLGSLFSGDVVHFNLDPNGLLFHIFNLPCGFLVHFFALRNVCFPFW